jgi:glycosyltransferase 2 family protein
VKKFWTRLLLSLLIGSGMLYLATRKIDFSGTWSALAAARWWVLLPYFAAMAGQHFFRSWRWGYLLAPIHPVPFSRILPVASVGFCAIIALPLRMGELVRPYLIADPPRLRMSQAFGTMAVERVIDGLLLSLTCFSVLMVARQTTTVPSWLQASGLVALSLFFIALVVLVMTLWQRQRAVALCRRLFGILSARLGQKLAEIAEGIVEGFRVLPDWRRLLPFLFGSLAYWLLNGVAIWVLGLGFGLGLSLYQGIAVMAIVGIGIMIPAGPGFIGNFELFAYGALGLYLGQDVIQQSGAAYVLTFHATNALWYVVTGALALLSPQISFTKIWQASSFSEEQLETPAKKLDKAPCSTDAS